MIQIRPVSRAVSQKAKSPTFSTAALVDLVSRQPQEPDMANLTDFAPAKVTSPFGSPSGG